MKSIVTKVMILGLLVSMAGTAALAKARKSNVTLAVDTKVNGTLVKKGMYDVVFDDESGELSIFKGAKLIVKTQARVEKREQKARTNELYTVKEGMEQKLVGISFGGTRENVLVTDAAMQAGGN
jgi:hypothetical protein